MSIISKINHHIMLCTSDSIISSIGNTKMINEDFINNLVLYSLTSKAMTLFPCGVNMANIVISDTNLIGGYVKQYVNAIPIILHGFSAEVFNASELFFKNFDSTTNYMLNNSTLNASTHIELNNINDTFRNLIRERALHMNSKLDIDFSIHIRNDGDIANAYQIHNSSEDLILKIRKGIKLTASDMARFKLYIPIK